MVFYSSLINISMALDGNHSTRQTLIKLQDSRVVFFGTCVLSVHLWILYIT